MMLPCMSESMFKPAFRYKDVALPQATDGCKWPSGVEGGREYITEISVDGRKKVILQLEVSVGGAKDCLS